MIIPIAGVFPREDRTHQYNPPRFGNECESWRSLYGKKAGIPRVLLIEQVPNTELLAHRHVSDRHGASITRGFGVEGNAPDAGIFAGILTLSAHMPCTAPAPHAVARPAASAARRPCGRLRSGMRARALLAQHNFTRH